MRNALLSLALGVLGGAAVQYGDLPHEWAQSARLYHAANVGDADYLAEVLGCTLHESLPWGKSMQCGETFLFIGSGGSARLALGNISNVQSEGLLVEGRAYTATVGTFGAGRVDRGVLFEGSCYGDVASCVMVRAQGWEFRIRNGRLELVTPNGVVRQGWRP